MSVFITSDEQKVRVYEIAAEMKKKGLPVKFICSSVEQALRYEGTHDLMVLWFEAENRKDRSEVLADLQDEIDNGDEMPKASFNKTYVKFDNLEVIAQDVLRFKKALRKIVDRQGGISKLAEKTGIPQPSLSRFFNSVSIPRRTTLYRIAAALNLDEKEILREWVA